MTKTYFSCLPDFICTQIYQCVFRNVLTEFHMVYKEHRHICNVTYVSQYSKIIEREVNREYIKYNYYTMLNQCKRGHFSQCVNSKHNIAYEMRIFVERVKAYQATHSLQIPDISIQRLFSSQYISAPIVDRLIKNIDNEYRKEYHNLFNTSS